MINSKSENNRIAKNSIVLLFRMLLMMGIAFYSSRILLRELGISDFGLYGVVGGVVAMFSSLRGIFASSIQRFLNYEMGKGDVKELNKVFSMGVIVHVLLSIIFFILAESLGLWFLEYKLVVQPERIIAVQWVFQFTVFTAIITILTIPYDAVIIANERMKAYAFISVLDAVLKFSVVLLLSLSSEDKLVLYAFSMLVVSIIIRTISWYYCIKNFKESRFKFVWDKRLLSKIGGFAGWNFLGNTAQTFSNEGLNLLLNIFGGTPVNAARSIAYQVRSIIMQFLNNILLAVNPHMIKLYAKNDDKEFYKVLYFISKVSFLVIFIAVMPLFFFLEMLLTVWLVDVPDFTVIFVKLIMVYLLIRSFHSPMDTLFKATGKIRNYQIVDSITIFLTLPFSYLALNHNLPIYYVFVIMVLVEILNLVSIVYLAYRMKKIVIRTYMIKVIFPCFLVTVICFPMCLVFMYYIKKTLSINEFISLILLVIINTFCVLLVGLAKEEKVLLYKRIKIISGNDK